VLILSFCAENTQTADANGDTRTISLHHIHTNEDITVTYKVNGRYDADAMKKLDWFLRDWRKAESTRMDPQVIDVLWAVQQQIGSSKPIWIVCGYRSPGTNAMLRRRSSGVAEFSQHTLGKAIDFYIPGANLQQTREIGLKLQRGGVGYYPTSGSPFVHMDVGSVRHWPRMTHEQLARLFPDGRTVHIPSDGKPLKNYALALADIEARGSSMPSAMSLASAHDAGVDTSAPPKRNLLAALFGGRKDDDEADAAAAATAGKPAPGARVAAIASDVKTKLESKKLAALARAASARSAPEPGSSETIAPVKVAALKVEAGKAEAVRAEPAKAEIAKVAAIPLPMARPKQAPAPAPMVVASADPAGIAAPATPAPAPARAAGGIFAARGVWDDREGLKQIDRANAYNLASYQIAYADTTATTGPALGYAAVLTHNPRRADGSPVEIVRPMRTAASFDDIWMRAMMLAPDLQHFMSATLLGTQDPKELRPLMRKPASTLAMTFSDDPRGGLGTNQFSGDAVVFLESTPLLTRTAMLP